MINKRSIKPRKVIFKAAEFWIVCITLCIWLFTRSRPAIVPVNVNIKVTLQNYSISSELSSIPDRLSSLWICTRDKIQRKPSLPPTHQYGLQFKNIHLILCILLAGDIATNPGPVNTNFNNSDATFSMFYQNVRSLKSTYWDSSSNTKESKLSCFHDVVMANQFDIIALTETWQTVRF